MPPIERVDARRCVKKGLRAVADFDGDEFDGFTFEHWHAFHRTVFINSVAACIAARGSRIILNEDMLGEFDTIGAFVDYVYDNSAYRGEPEDHLVASDGDLRPA